MRSLLRLVLILVLVGLFLLQVKDSVVKFLTNQTTIAISKDTKESLALPPLSFCPGYRDGLTVQEVMERLQNLLDGSSNDNIPSNKGKRLTREDLMSWFLLHTYDVNEILSTVRSDNTTISRTFSKTPSSEDYLLEQDGVILNESWTIYGRCFTVKFSKNIEEQRFYNLIFNMTTLPRGLEIFWHEEHGEIGLNWNNWPILAPAIKLALGDEVSVYVSKILTLDRDVGIPCSEEPNHSYSKCCTDWVRRSISSNQPPVCWYPQVETITENLNLSLCANSSQVMFSRKIIFAQTLMNVPRQHVSGCPLKCLQPRYKLEKRIEPVANSVETKQGMAKLFVFHTMTVETQEQYLLFDLNAIVAAVGGSLGLFLGFSCFSLFDHLIDFVMYKQKCSVKKQKKPQDY